jgi:6-phosphogluconolactonase
VRKRKRIESYGFEEVASSAPPLPGEVVVAPDLDELLDRLSSDLVAHAINCVRRFGDFHLAFSGEEGLDPLFTRLMVDPDCRALPWRRTHLWLVNERCVPLHDDASMFRPIDESIVDHADIPMEQVHPLLAESQTADRDYEHQIREALSWREKGHDRLDYVLLLLGPDGRVAGLVPHADALREERRLVRFSMGEPAGPPQVTMTLPLINAARFVAVVALGSAVSDALWQLTRADGPVDELPARGIAPLDGELRWYLDAAACGDVEALA